MKRILNILIFSLILLTYSCNESVVEPDAIPLTIEEMLTTPGYTWVNEVLATYQQDAAIYAQIKTLIDTTRDKFVIFARAACSCPDEKKEFAQVAKILLDLEKDKKITRKNWEMFAMSSRSNPNPYSNICKINNLPEIVYLRNGVPYFNFIDTLRYVISNNLKYPVKVEELMLEALKRP